MDFYETVKTRRCIRKYRPDAVPEDVFKRVLDAGRMAPSAGSPYDVRLIVISDPGIRKKMVPLCGGQEFTAEAPLLIAVCARNVKKNRGGYMGGYGMLVDGAIVADHVTLAARAEGLATCWIGSFDNEGVKTLLSIPGDFNVVALMPVGLPADPGLFRESSGKKKPEEFACFNEWSWKF